LDTPEVLEAWITERKNRWPSTIRVEEKRKKLAEAIGRGQLCMVNSGYGRKGPKMGESTAKGRQLGHRLRDGQERGRGRNGARRRDRGTDAGWRGRLGHGEFTTEVCRNVADGVGYSSATMAARGTQSAVQTDLTNYDSSSDDDDDDEPDVISSKQLSGLTNAEMSLHTGGCGGTTHGMDGGGGGRNMVLEPSKDNKSQTFKPLKKNSQSLPKKLPQNPFASRPTLLRNVSHDT
jgi:Nuclear fragile X mental retardation-interacting protein 1 (NUFIP1).